MINYFTYGSNLNIKRAKRRGVNVLDVEAATLQHWQLTFSVINEMKENAGFANIIPKKDEKVAGAIIYTDEKSVLALDEYEDYPIDYLKKQITVQTKSGTSIICFAYVGNPERVRPNLHSTQPYLAHILEGQPFMSDSYYQKLKKTKTV